MPAPPSGYRSAASLPMRTERSRQARSAHADATVDVFEETGTLAQTREQKGPATCTVNIQLSSRQTERLLDELCVDLGFCLPREAKAQLMAKPLSSSDEFSEAVIRAEGLDPEAVSRRLYRDVKERVTKHFKAAEDEARTGRPSNDA